DFRNQLALASECEAAIIDQKLDTKSSIEQVFRKAQQAINTWSKYDAGYRTTERLWGRQDIDFFRLLDSLTSARSRKYLTTSNDTSAIGKCPKRNEPLAIQSPLTEY